MSTFLTPSPIARDLSQDAGLASAYEAILLRLSGGELARFPDRSTRSVLVTAMISEGHRNGFDARRLTVAGLSAIGHTAAFD